MLIAIKVFWWSAILMHMHANANYTNSTIKTARMISDDFEIFQKTGKRVSGRDGRRLISFDTKNNNIEVGLEFAVPFLTIPVQRSMDSVKSWTSQSMAFVSDPMMNINTGAIALTGAVLVGGFVTTYLWKSLMKDQMHFNNGPNYFPNARENDFDHKTPLSHLLEKLERIFHKYDIDVTTCVQKYVCTTIRSAVENVAKGNGSSTDKIFDGLSSIWMDHRQTAGTAISDAIRIAQKSADCDKKFTECNMDSKNLRNMFDLLLRTMN